RLPADEGRLPPHLLRGADDGRLSGRNLVPQHDGRSNGALRARTFGWRSTRRGVDLCAKSDRGADGPVGWVSCPVPRRQGRRGMSSWEGRDESGDSSYDRSGLNGRIDTQGVFPMPYTLPPLPYATNALEPSIDTMTMEIHHGRHHKAYVDNLNKALE